MAEQLDPKNVDKRTAARYIRAGQVDEKAYEKLLKALPDLADRTAPIDTTMADTDADDEESEEDAD